MSIKTKRKVRIRQYVIVVDKNVFIRPFGNMIEAEDWAHEYAGVRPSKPHFIQVVHHLDISSRFNLEY